MMIRTIGVFLFCLLLSQPLFAIELVVYNWPSYLASEVKTRFTQETGIQIKELYYDSDEARNRLLLSEHPPVMDIVVIDYLTLKHEVWASLLSPKPAEGYSSQRYSDPRFSQSCGDHAAPYFWGSVGIAYRSTQVTQPITGWTDLLIPSTELSGHIVMIDDAMDLVSIALKSLHYSINTGQKEELEAAFKLLKSQKPHVLSYALSLAAIRDPELSHNIYAVVTYSGDFYSLKSMSEFQDWKYVAPVEGSPLWVDCLAVSQSSRHPLEAATFINFLMRPDIARLNGKQLGFTPTLKDQQIPTTMREDPVAYPAGIHLQQSEYYRDISSSEHIRNAIYFTVLK